MASRHLSTEECDIPVKGQLDSIPQPNNALMTNSGIETTPYATRADVDEAKAESERQALFQNVVNNDLDIPTGYVSVAVNIVRWHNRLDSFSSGHDQEIRRLKAILQDCYNFEIAETKLDTFKNPQNELNFRIMQHINDHDGPNNLLVVYYTGHGSTYDPADSQHRHGSGPSQSQRLELSATASSHKKTNDPYRATVFWDEAEALLLRESVESDVLVILDCCFAGNAHKGPLNENRSFELLAACARDQRTQQPGDKSFTTALTNALDHLYTDKDNHNYSTFKLNDRINAHRKTESILCDRLHKYEKHIQLRPLEKRASQNKANAYKSLEPERAWIKLRFSLKEQHIPLAQIERFARNLPKACTSAKLPIRRIDWIKMESSSSPPSGNNRLKRAATAVMGYQRLRRLSSQPQRRENTSSSPTLKRKRSGDSSMSSRRRSSGLYVDTLISPKSTSTESPSSIIVSEPADADIGAPELVDRI